MEETEKKPKKPKKRKLTLKEARFAKVCAHNANMAESARIVYNVKNNDSAKSLGSRVANKPHVKKAIEAEICRISDKSFLDKKLMNLINIDIDDNPQQANVVRASIELAYKLRGDLVEKREIKQDTQIRNSVEKLNNDELTAELMKRIDIGNSGLKFNVAEKDVTEDVATV